MKDNQPSSSAAAAAQAATTATAAAMVLSKASEAVAIIGNDISWMKQSLSGIEGTLKEMSGTFVTVTKFTELEKSAEDREIRIRSLEKNTNVWIGVTTLLVFIIPILIKIFFK